MSALLRCAVLSACCAAYPLYAVSSTPHVLDEPAASGGLSLQWLFAMGTPAARPTAVPDWPQLLALATERAPSNRAANAGLLAAQAREKQAWINAWLPNVNAFANRASQRQTYNGIKSQTPSSSVSLSATWPLWRAAERAQVSAQALLTQQSAWQETVNQQQVALSLSTAYLDGLEAQGLYVLTQAQHDLLAQQLRINERRMQGGAGTILDVLETRSRLEQALSALQSLSGRQQSQRLLIERLAGQSVQWPSLSTALATPNLPMVVPSLDDALVRVENHNPPTESARAEWASAREVTRVRKYEQWQPSIDLVGQSSRSKQTARFEGISETQQVNTQSVGVQLNWPLFTSGFQNERNKEAAALLVQAQAQFDDVHSQARTEIKSAYDALAQARKTMVLEQQVVQTSQAGFDAVRKAFTAGVRDNIDVLNAQSQVYAAQQNLLSATVDALAAQANILALLGELSPPTIAPLTAVMVPADNAPPTP